jgi:hypothetical protein
MNIMSNSASPENIAISKSAKQSVVKPKISIKSNKNLQNKNDTDIEIEFDEEMMSSSSGETDVLDDYLLASMDATLDESDEE